MSLPWNFASLWKQQELSDVDIELMAADNPVHPAFPGHSQILSSSPYLKAQVGRPRPHDVTKATYYTGPCKCLFRATELTLSLQTGTT